MSLSYLKTEPSVPKHEKVPKPENIAALREALLSVMKNEGITATQTIPTNASQTAGVISNATDKVKSENSHTANHLHVESVKSNKEKNQSSSEEKIEHKSHRDADNTNSLNRYSHSNNVSHNSSATHTKIVKEVEESELKDIFAE
jgi:hypothetical protein